MKVLTSEKSSFDYAPIDSNRLGLFYSMADQINKDIFNEFHAKLPFFTQFLINSSNLICKNIKFYLILILSCILVLKISYKKSYKFKYLLDFIIWRCFC